MAEQQDAALNMLGQSLFSGDAYQQRQQRFNLASQALNMQAQRQQVNNQLSSAVRDNYENSMQIANNASVRPYDRKRLEAILGGGYENVINEIKTDFNGDFLMYSNNVDANGVSGADKIRNIFFNDDLQNLYEEMDHNKRQFTKIIDLQKSNESHLIPAAYANALEKWSQNSPTDGKPELNRLPTFYKLKDVSGDLEEYYADKGGHIGSTPQDIINMPQSLAKIFYNMEQEGYSQDEIAMAQADVFKGQGPGYDMVIDFIKSNHVTSGLVNPESPTYVTGAKDYSKGDVLARIIDEINLESYDISIGENYESIVKGVQDIFRGTGGYIERIQAEGPVVQKPLPYEHYGPLVGKGKRLVTGAVIADNNEDMKNMIETTLPGYNVQEGSTFFIKDGSLKLKNYNFVKHGNVYHADDGTLAGKDEVFNLGEGITYATGTGVAGAGIGSVTGPGAAIVGGGAFVAGGLSYAMTTELNEIKDFTINKIVVGYKLNFGDGESELLLDFEDKNSSKAKAYAEKFNFEDVEAFKGSLEPVILAYATDDDLTFGDPYAIELAFTNTALGDFQERYSEKRESYTRSVEEGKANNKNFQYSQKQAQIESQRQVKAVENAQGYINNMFSKDNNPNTFTFINNTFGTPLRSYAKSANIPETGAQANQSLLLAEILVTSQYVQDKKTLEYSKLRDDQGTKVATDAINKINNLQNIMAGNRGKLKAFQTLSTKDILAGFNSFYPPEMVKEIEQLTRALRDLKGQ